MSRRQHPLPSQAKQAGKETTEVVLEFYLLMFYFTGRFTRGGEVARVEAWPFGVWRAENPFCWLLEAASCAFPELPSVPWQFRETPGEMRAVAEKRSLHFRGCPSAASADVSDRLEGEVETRTCPFTINLCEATTTLGHRSIEHFHHFFLPTTVCFEPTGDQSNFCEPAISLCSLHSLILR